MSKTTRRARGPLPKVVPAFAAGHHTYQEIVTSDHDHFKPILSMYTEDQQKVLKRFRQTHRKRVCSLHRGVLPFLIFTCHYFQDDARSRYETRRSYLEDLRDKRAQLHQEASLLQQKCEELRAQAKAYQKKKRELERKKAMYEVTLEAQRPPDAWPIYRGSVWPSTSTGHQHQLQ